MEKHCQIIQNPQGAKLWILGNGKRIRFWEDKWVRNLVTMDFVRDIPPNLKNLMVVDFINWNNRTWDIQKIQPCCPNFILQKILSIPIPDDMVAEFCRTFNKNGTFTLKNAYSWLIEKEKPFNQPGLPWHKIWDLRIQPRNKFLCGNWSKTACLTRSSSTKGKSSTLICALYVIILMSNGNY